MRAWSGVSNAPARSLRTLKVFTVVTFRTNLLCSGQNSTHWSDSEIFTLFQSTCEIQHNQYRYCRLLSEKDCAYLNNSKQCYDNSVIVQHLLQR